LCFLLPAVCLQLSPSPVSKVTRTSLGLFLAFFAIAYVPSLSSSKQNSLHFLQKAPRWSSLDYFHVQLPVAQMQVDPDTPPPSSTSSRTAGHCLGARASHHSSPASLSLRGEQIRWPWPPRCQNSPRHMHSLFFFPSFAGKQAEAHD